ncbi:PAAR domain-containing protein [Psychrobacter immobilis]|uniref:PAAR domain-containing protein n=1 Tax=Psychrobacter immobilis TaxID=498 RepID=UPI00191B7562|nr:PAAR domain-containing protein [Psychrobacter immobilis]
MAAYITVGAKTSHGGTVITGSPYTTHNGIPVARKGDKVMCKKCKKVTTILSGDASFIVDGAPIARGGDVTSCGAKLIATQQAFAESDFEVMCIEQAEKIRREAQEYFNEAMGDYNLQFVMRSHNQNPLAKKPYVIYDEDGEIFQMGKLDDEGQTPVLNDAQEKEYFIHVLDEEVINE